jgi:hypothetical protein|tara:strand:+ start:2492 stop:3211 length:720 start_codon:yes stop_codon:yes gene_type:complete
MGFSGGGSNILKAHKHDGTVSQDGGSLDMDNVTQADLTAGDIVYSDGSHLQRLAIGSVADSLTVSAGNIPAWGAGGASGSWIEIANQDDGDSIDIGGAASTIFDDYKYVKMICDYKQTASNYCEFQFYDSGGLVTSNQTLFQQGENTPVWNPYATSATTNRMGYAEAGNIMMHEILWQINTSGTHQCVMFNSVASSNNVPGQFSGVCWISTSNRLTGIKYSGLSTIVGGTASYKVLGLT